MEIIDSEQALKDIVKHDQENDTRYIETLRYYRMCNKNAKKTAGAMFVHKNTVIYRLGRLNQLFQLNVDDDVTWFNICFSLDLIEYYDLFVKHNSWLQRVNHQGKGGKDSYNEGSGRGF